MQNDFIGVFLVYMYVAILILSTEKLSKKHPHMSRKILHIMVGNIAFILPIFETREIMAFVAAAPFILFTFLMSPYTPVKSIRGKTSSAGHGMGLVYYAITWTILAYLFFDNMIAIAIGILAMSYGDGFASLIGLRYGKKKYNVFGDEKSYLGSICMFIFTFVTILIAFVFYQIPITLFLIIVFLIICLFATVLEGITPKGVDNLTVPFFMVFCYWFVFLSGYICV